MTTMAPLKRADVPLEQTWNRESVFASWEDFQQELDDIAASLPDLEKYAGRLGESPNVAADWLETYTRTHRRVDRLVVFTGMSTFVDTHDDEAKAGQGQAMSLMGKLNATSAFAEPELLALGDTLRDWIRQNPHLTIYAHYFDNLLRQQEHKQSPAVEKVLGMLQDTFSGPEQTYSALTDTDMRFPDALDSNGQAHHVTQDFPPPAGIESQDRVLRRHAWENFCDQHRAMENTLASNFITSVRQQVFLARMRGYDSVLEATLAPANLPVEVFHNVIDTFKANLPVWHRYWAAKHKALGVDHLHPWDIWAPLTADEPRLTYMQAIEWICEGVRPLGVNYVNTLRQGCLEERWVDYAQNEGRAQGAFGFPAHNTHPFVFCTFDGSLGAMSGLAHELGHAMHDYLIDQHQPGIYVIAGASGAVGETASNFHQAMVRAHLRQAKADDRAFQLALINEEMFNFHRYFFIMPLLAGFEFEVYSRAENDQPLNSAVLNDIMRTLFAEGYGETLTDDPDRTAITWAQFMHLYYQPFYTFQYSVGISAAHALAEGILASKSGAVENYLAMLKAGWSRYAPDLFRLAGIDMTQPEPVQQTFGVLERLVEQLESLADG